jgi:hypothetical protein
MGFDFVEGGGTLVLLRRSMIWAMKSLLVWSA